MREGYRFCMKPWCHKSFGSFLSCFERLQAQKSSLPLQQSKLSAEALVRSAQTLSRASLLRSQCERGNTCCRAHDEVLMDAVCEDSLIPDALKAVVASLEMLVTEPLSRNDWLRLLEETSVQLKVQLSFRLAG